MRREPSTRRRFLAATAGLISAAASTGCFGGGQRPDSEGSTTESVGTTVTTPVLATTTGGETTVGTDTATIDRSLETTSVAPQTVTFDGTDGVTVEGTVYGSGDCGVILVPQINLDRESWQPQAEELATMGHLVLSIDENPDNRAASVRGAIRYLREQRSVSTVVLLGASSGGEAVVRANAATDAPVAGTVTLSAAGAADQAGDLQGRSLFVVSTGDEDRFVQTARQLAENAPEPSRLIEYEGSAHGQAIFGSEHGEDLLVQVTGFVRKACRQ